MVELSWIRSGDAKLLYMVREASYARVFSWWTIVIGIAACDAPGEENNTSNNKDNERNAYRSDDDESHKKIVMF